MGIPVLAELVHLLPEPLHGRHPGLVAEVGQVAVDVVHLGAPLPRLDGPAARNPYRGMGLLHGTGPDVDVAKLVEAPVEGEGLGFLPGLHDDVVGLEIALAEFRRVLAVGEHRVHGRAHRETRDQPAARHAVEHRELLRHAGRGVVERQGVAHHADGRGARAARQGRGDEVGRRHQAVAVLVVLVAADAVEAHLARVLEFVEVLVVVLVHACGVEQP